MIQKNPDDWERTVMVIGKPDYIRMLETKLLVLLDAENDDLSFNLTNGQGTFGMTGRKHSEESNRKRSETNKVKMNDPIVKEKISKKLTGVKTNRKPKTAFGEGHTPWNKGKKVTSPDHPWKNNGNYQRKENL